MALLNRNVEGQEASNTVRHNLNRLFTKQGISARCKMNGVSDRSVYNFMAGRSDITISKLEMIARHLKVSVRSLFRGLE